MINRNSIHWLGGETELGRVVAKRVLHFCPLTHETEVGVRWGVFLSVCLSFTNYQQLLIADA